MIKIVNEKCNLKLKTSSPSQIIYIIGCPEFCKISTFLIEKHDCSKHDEAQIQPKWIHQIPYFLKYRIYEKTNCALIKDFTN